MTPHTFRRLIGNLLGIRRRRYRQITLARRWDELSRREGELAEAAVLARGRKRFDAQRALRRHHIEMLLFREANGP